MPRSVPNRATPYPAMRSLRITVPLVLLAAGACDSSARIAMGDANSIIVVADSALWADVGDEVTTALQPEIFAVRSEPAFRVTGVSPASAAWSDLRRFRTILAIGRAEDPWVRAVLDEADTTVSAPAIAMAEDVWVRNQSVTALVVPEEGAAEAVRAHSAELAALLRPDGHMRFLGRHRDAAVLLHGDNRRAVPAGKFTVLGHSTLQKEFAVFKVLSHTCNGAREPPA